jgi:hypothetical protein
MGAIWSSILSMAKISESGSRAQLRHHDRQDVAICCRLLVHVLPNVARLRAFLGAAVAPRPNWPTSLTENRSYPMPLNKLAVCKSFSQRWDGLVLLGAGLVQMTVK